MFDDFTTLEMEAIEANEQAWKAYQDEVDAEMRYYYEKAQFEAFIEMFDEMERAENGLQR